MATARPKPQRIEGKETVEEFLARTGKTAQFPVYPSTQRAAPIDPFNREPEPGRWTKEEREKNKKAKKAKKTEKAKPAEILRDLAQLASPPAEITFDVETLDDFAAVDTVRPEDDIPTIEVWD